MNKDFLKIAIRNLKSRKLRSWLTIMGVVIGVFLVIFLFSLSQGIKQAVLAQLKMMGSDVLMIYPGEASNIMMSFAGGMELSEEDLEVVKKSEGVEKVIPQNYKGQVARWKKKRKTVFLYGIPFSEKEESLKSKIGMQPRRGEYPEKGKREVIVGSLVPTDIFPGLKVEDEVYVSGKRFEVAGILKSLGNKNDDSMIGANLEAFKQVTGEREGYPFFMATIKSGFKQDVVASNVKENLEENRKRKRDEEEAAVSVITSEKAMDMMGGVMGVIQTAIFVIASFAILVGAIGIMNTMYTSVKERTKEIGIMKATGAKTSDISILFLIESGIVGLIGGLGGTILGIGAAKLVEFSMKFSASFPIEAHISLPLILGGLLVTGIIGCIFGYMPARQASQLKPADALRYE